MFSGVVTNGFDFKFELSDISVKTNGFDVPLPVVYDCI
jgi:hypothetical protein